MTKPTQGPSRDEGSRFDVRLPPGVRDFLPRATARRTKIASDILAQFDHWGFQRIITPQFEVADVLERGLGADASRAAIRFIEPEMGDVALLRPDITPQVARIAATRLDETGGPLRLCYHGTVIRDGRGARRQREILQAGVELIGAPAPRGDSEMIALAAEVLLAANPPFSAASSSHASPSHASHSCRLEVGHVGPTQTCLAEVQDLELRSKLTDALARRDLSAMAQLTAALPSLLGDVLRLLPRLSGPLAEMAAGPASSFPILDSALDEIRAVIDGARELAPKAMRRIPIVVDLGEVGSFPYYTGVRIAGWLAGAGDSVLVGGRYDHLVARFGRDRAATGFAVDIEALAQAQKIAGVGAGGGRGVLIVGKAPRSTVIAAALRSAGVRATVEIGGLRGRRPPLRYADAVGLCAVLFIDERGGELCVGGEKRKIPETVVKRLAAADRSTLASIRTAIRTQERNN